MKRFSLLTLLLCLCLHSLPAQPVWNPDNGDGPPRSVKPFKMGLGLPWTANRFALVNFSKSDEGIGGTADFNWFRFNNH